MAKDGRPGDLFVPAEAAVRHSGRTEQLGLHHAAKAHLHDRLDDQLQPDEGFARIGVACSRRLARDERSGGPVGQAGRMRQHVPGRDPFQVRVIAQVRGPAVHDERRVQVQALFIDQPHHDIGEDRLGHGRRFKQRVLAHRVAGEHVFHAKAAAPGELSAVHDRDGDAGDPGNAHEAWKLLNQVFRRNPGGILVPAGRARTGAGGRRPAADGQRRRSGQQSPPREHRSRRAHLGFPRSARKSCVPETVFQGLAASHPPSTRRSARGG